MARVRVATPRRRRMPAQRWRRACTVLPRGFVGRGHLVGGHADERRQGHGDGTRPRRRLLECFEQAQPVTSARRPEYAFGPADHRRHADGPEGGLHQASLAIGANQHPDVAG